MTDLKVVSVKNTKQLHQYNSFKFVFLFNLIICNCLDL